MNRHIRIHHIHDKHKMHSKKLKADGEVSTSSVVLVNDSLAIYGDGDGMMMMQCQSNLIPTVIPMIY